VQLDQTHVVIRVRTLSEIGDLALTMIRRYPRSFFQVFFAGALPWMLLNVAVLGWIPWQVQRDQLYDSQSAYELLRYAYWMMTLVIVQVPLAGAMSTVYLGQAVFESKPTFRRVWRDVRQRSGALMWTLGIRRLTFPLILIPLWRIGQGASIWWDFWVPTFALLWVAVQRSGRPFVPEMLLLEQCPLRSRDESVITLRRRSGSLHAPIMSELSSRFLTVAFVFAFLVASLCMSMVFARGLLTGVWANDGLAWLIFYPLSLWLVGSFSVVVRLLGYLDARIRLEGWEVELAVRAEAIRQFGEDATPLLGQTVPPNSGESLPGNRSANHGPADNPSVSDNSPGNRPAGRTGAVVSALLLAFTFASMPTPAAGAPVADRATSPQSVFTAWSGHVGRPAFLAQSSLADSPTAAPESYLEDTAWYDASEETLQPVPVKERSVDAANRSSRWSAGPSQPWNFDFSWLKLIGWIILIVAAIGVAFLAGWLLRYAEFDFGRSQTDALSMTKSDQLDEQTRKRIEELPPELRQEEGHPRAIAEHWMKQGNFERAIVALFGHQLLLLDRVGWLRLSRGKTNRRYVTETRRHQTEAGRLLKETVDAFEYVYFGRHSLDADTFSRMWEQNEKLESLVSSTSEQAA